MNFPEGYEPEGIDYEHASIYDRQILKQLNETIEKMNASMDKFEFVIAGQELYNFIWDDFCSIYVEMAKLSLQGTDNELRQATQSVMFYVLDAILKLAHPFIPFVTEDIYQNLHDGKKGPLINSKWPEANEKFSENIDEITVNVINKIIKTVRTMKNDNNIAPNKNIAIHLGIENDALRAEIEKNKHYIQRFCFADKTEIEKLINTQEQGKAFALTANVNLFIPLSGLINIEEEIARLEKESVRLDGEIKRCEGMLNNPNFINKAPQAKIDTERNKLLDYQQKKKSVLEKLEEYKKL